jgi:hypothetical protein
VSGIVWPPAIDADGLRAFVDAWERNPGTPLLPLLQRIRGQTAACVREGRVAFDGSTVTLARDAAVLFVAAYGTDDMVCTHILDAGEGDECESTDVVGVGGDGMPLCRAHLRSTDPEDDEDGHELQPETLAAIRALQAEMRARETKS